MTTDTARRTRLGVADHDVVPERDVRHLARLRPDSVEGELTDPDRVARFRHVGDGDAAECGVHDEEAVDMVTVCDDLGGVPVELPGLEPSDPFERDITVDAGASRMRSSSTGVRIPSLASRASNETDVSNLRYFR